MTKQTIADLKIDLEEQIDASNEYQRRVTEQNRRYLLVGLRVLNHLSINVDQHPHIDDLLLHIDRAMSCIVGDSPKLKSENSEV